MGHVIQSPFRRLTLLNLEIFRLKEEDNTRTTFHLKFFSKFFQKLTPRKLLFARKKNMVILLKELKPSSYRKMMNTVFLYLITCLRHYDIFAKSCSRMMTIKFSRQNVADSPARFF